MLNRRLHNAGGFLRSKLKKTVRADCFLLVRKWDVICILSAYSANNGVER